MPFSLRLMLMKLSLMRCCEPHYKRLGWLRGGCLTRLQLDCCSNFYHLEIVPLLAQHPEQPPT